MTEHTDMRAFQGATITGRYRLDQFLDEGAFGAVYRATHLAYGVALREVAIKVGKRVMTEDEAQKAFGEALLLARVADGSPDASLRQHFINVHDAGFCAAGEPLAGRPYVVMELVRGGSLQQSLRAGPFPLTRAIAYFDQILRAMAFMHSDAAGRIAHRDLKPSNILVTRPDNAPDVVKLTDFGLAVEVDALLGWVESGGDLAYLAPESFSHDICSLQSDVYMLGLVFYEMLTGVSPFAEVGAHLRGDDEAKRAELRRLHLAARQSERFARLEEHEELRQRPDIAQVIRTALQVSMSARAYTNAGEFQRAWEQAKQGRAAERAERPWETVRRLTDEAEQSFRVGDQARSDALLEEALALNRDRRRVPDPMLVGSCYLLMVERLIRRREVAEAGLLANEGYQRRRCRATCLAMARYYEALKSPVAAEFVRQAEASPA
jgi:serine/threonine protein kinase